jgi:hypothetical protein
MTAETKGYSAQDDRVCTPAKFYKQLHLPARHGNASGAIMPADRFVSTNL